MKHNDEMISLRLPSHVVVKIEAEATASGRTRSEVIRDTLGREFPILRGYDPRAAKVDMSRRLRAVSKKIFDPKRVA